MIRPCFILCLVAFINIPKNTYSFFTLPLLEIIEPSGNLVCYLNSMESSNNDFQLCAIRVYIPANDSIVSNDVIIQNGMWFTNIFRRFIITRNCSGFTESSDIGMSICNPMPYENARKMILCICATDNCNQNLETCQFSNIEYSNPISLQRSLPILTVPIECNQTSEISEACFENALINMRNCDIYMKNHSVLCGIGVDHHVIMQKLFIEENYEIYFDQHLYALKPIIHANPTNRQKETDTYIYYMFYNVTDVTIEQCACIQSPYCNNNISMCAPYSVQTEVWTSMESSSISSTFIPSEHTSDTSIITITTESTIDYTTEPLTTMNTIADIFTETTTPIDFISTMINSETDITTDSIILKEFTLTETVINKTYSSRENPTIEISSLNNNIIIGIVIGVPFVLFICLGLIYCRCKCTRSKSCHCPCSDRSNDYQI
ncbi:unnamed protein product [Adineta steineri]|uniref:Uncharacterized protein n=1 Tax=Adineta steineri TaxID=433720 RepID=A0A818ID14_9BILA|nr:unnamed protein product [Adineta steineri]